MELLAGTQQRAVPDGVYTGHTTNGRQPSIKPGILVVDNDECMRELVYLHLANAGYEVTTAEDAVAALKLLLHCRPHLVVIDVDIPYMDGLELVRAMKTDALYRDTPVVFLTARHDVDEEAQKLGVLACLKKPLLASQLLSTVAAALPDH